MDGFLITYDSKNDISRVKFNHILFGRILYRTRRGKRYAYYVPGMLDNTPFFRIMNSRIFVRDIDTLNIEVLKEYVELNIVKCIREITVNHMKTGERYWEDFANEKGLNLKRAKKRTI